MNCVGMAYENGDGVPKDLNKAREFYIKFYKRNGDNEMHTWCTNALAQGNK